MQGRDRLPGEEGRGGSQGNPPSHATGCGFSARGEAFDIKTGLPESMLKARSPRTLLEFAQAQVSMKWPHLAAKSRGSMSDALATVTLALCKDTAGRPAAAGRVATPRAVAGGPKG